jgi:hypothetical protein
MAYQSSKQPHCRCCGKPIPKYTDNVYVRHSDDLGPRLSGQVEGPLFTKADCQAKTNHQVMSVAYEHGERRVWKFSTWDGESYVDEFFCKGTCATRLAYVMARGGHCTVAYNDAVKKARA